MKYKKLINKHYIDEDGRLYYCEDIRAKGWCKVTAIKTKLSWNADINLHSIDFYRIVSKEKDPEYFL